MEVDVMCHRPRVGPVPRRGDSQDVVANGDEDNFVLDLRHTGRIRMGLAPEGHETPGGSTQAEVDLGVVQRVRYSLTDTLEQLHFPVLGVAPARQERQFGGLEAGRVVAQIGGHVREACQYQSFGAENPGDAGVRRHRYQAVDAWGVMASGDGEDWIILWQLPPSEPDVILVPYGGPASFI
jgi:hypothetical protein